MDTIKNGRGRVSDLRVSLTAIDNAVDILGDVRASGKQLRELDRVYSLIVHVQSFLRGKVSTEAA
jgi:hypothetical protein